jgi:hypothetical protein
VGPATPEPFSLKGCVPYLARSLLTIAATLTGIG